MAEDYNEIDNVFFNDGYTLAGSILKNFVSQGGLLRLSETLYANIDELLEAFEKRVKKENQKLDCKKACHWCCTQAVFINPWEAHFISDYLKTNFNNEEISDYKIKIDSKDLNTKSMTMKRLLTNKQECPFLQEKSCSIYPARPVACRIYLSMSVESCKKFYKQPEIRANYAKLYQFPLHAGKMLSEGSAAFLRDKKIDVPVITLESAMNHILNTENAIELWLRGEKPFPVPEYSDQDYEDLKNFEMNENEA
ncbi:MAG: YkgJ family cysteine cluster protein [Bacteroidales bacterium]|nr:YkgJ family cysteine cluster protein [Bacteroidales bacterium]MCF8389490.1 YkgJ family cysteine cluster protein [Bacteroidales bacterium]